MNFDFFTHFCLWRRYEAAGNHSSRVIEPSKSNYLESDITCIRCRHIVMHTVKIIQRFQSSASVMASGLDSLIALIKIRIVLIAPVLPMMDYNFAYNFCWTRASHSEGVRENNLCYFFSRCRLVREERRDMN